MLSNQHFVEPSSVGVLILPLSIYCGVDLVQIDLPERCALLGLIREGQLVGANTNPIIHSFDYISGIAIHLSDGTSVKSGAEENSLNQLFSS